MNRLLKTLQSRITKLNCIPHCRKRGVLEPMMPIPATSVGAEDATFCKMTFWIIRFSALCARNFRPELFLPQDPHTRPIILHTFGVAFLRPTQSCHRYNVHRPRKRRAIDVSGSGRSQSTMLNPKPYTSHSLLWVLGHYFTYFGGSRYSDTFVPASGS